MSSESETLIGAVYSSRDFRYDAALNHFTGNLTLTPGVLRELWSDDMTLGFGIASAKTGRVVLFVLDEIERGEQGQTESIAFVVHNPDNNPSLDGLTARISA